MPVYSARVWVEATQDDSGTTINNYISAGGGIRQATAHVRRSRASHTVAVFSELCEVSAPWTALVLTVHSFTDIRELIPLSVTHQTSHV